MGLVPWFLILGIILLVGGSFAVILPVIPTPVIPTIEASLVFGIVQALSGIVKTSKPSRISRFQCLSIGVSSGMTNHPAQYLTEHP
jgi:uncharacterized membrane protein HdeD (DUF308 family)